MMVFVVALAVAAVVAGLLALGVLVAQVAGPARRLNRAVGDLRLSLDAGLRPLRSGFRRPST